MPSEKRKMGGGGGGPAASGSSSSDDDGDAAWKAAIDSIAAVGFGVSATNVSAKVASGDNGEANHSGELEKPQTPGLKLYQIKVSSFARIPSLYAGQQRVWIFVTSLSWACWWIVRFIVPFINSSCLWNNFGWPV
jgi:hypothetical protein